MITENNIDKLAFRHALGNFATGITVMTATSPEGNRVGVTANSFNSVSLEPALILWSIEKTSSSFSVFETASHFAVNILAADQMHLSNHFAKRSDDKFAAIDFEEGRANTPLLKGCAATFQCERHAVIEGGDHWIIIGKVVAFNDEGKAPLLYHQGSYSLVMPLGRQNPTKESNTENNIDIAQSDNELNNYLYFLMIQAIRSYQADYQPKQLGTGLHTAEARILMSLKTEQNLTLETLSGQVNMPDHDLQDAINLLQNKGFISKQGADFSLQDAGKEMATTLWKIALDEQKHKFENFSDEEVTTFKRMLIDLINQH
ncbi:flavin reductase family protein [Haliea sp. AH-315-K21]|uniref:Flavin oxidoreductase n=1 Tax=SAR86 cluster bacterium TaxID=2030880 RepID=A0A2A5C993_9GAMM|nr:flavin reductase family protein [Haliea sp. AH-315-K21]PCJ40333.1 MAG: flavin oxidoreductase [SAR86 cluster bacterium]